MPTSNEQIYINYMAEVKVRIDFLQSYDFHDMPKPPGVELFALQLRKLCEMVVFASLAINKEQYAKLHSDFEKHWRLKSIIKQMKVINPYYLPLPIHLYMEGGEPRWSYPTGPDYLDENDLIEIYDESSKIIHAKMPFLESAANIEEFLSKVVERVNKFVVTLNRHRIIPPQGEEYFVITMFPEGRESPVIQGFQNIGPGLLRDGKELEKYRK